MNNVELMILTRYLIQGRGSLSKLTIPPQDLWVYTWLHAAHSAPRNNQQPNLNQIRGPIGWSWPVHILIHRIIPFPVITLLQLQLAHRLSDTEQGLQLLTTAKQWPPLLFSSLLLPVRPLSSSRMSLPARSGALGVAVSPWDGPWRALLRASGKCQTFALFSI